VVVVLAIRRPAIRLYVRRSAHSKCPIDPYLAL
jgi:hypothetical protein